MGGSVCPSPFARLVPRLDGGTLDGCFRLPNGLRRTPSTPSDVLGAAYVETASDPRRGRSPLKKRLRAGGSGKAQVCRCATDASLA